MSTNETVQALLAAAQDLADRAVSDNELAERLIANTNETIAEAAGHPVPAGVVMTAQRKDDGVVEISAQADPQFEGELDDAALEGVAGGASAIEYGLIAALISVSVVSAAGSLGKKLSGQFDKVNTTVAPALAR